MKRQPFLLLKVFLFLSLLIFASCDSNSTDDDLYQNIEKSNVEKVKYEVPPNG